MFFLIRPREGYFSGIGKGSIRAGGCGGVELRRSCESPRSRVTAVGNVRRPLTLHHAEGQSRSEREDLTGSAMPVVGFAVATTISATATTGGGVVVIVVIVVGT